MLKANESLNNLRIFPMVTAIDELRSARQLILRCHDEVKGEGFTTPLPPIGVMIEVPAACIYRCLQRRPSFCRSVQTT